MNESGAYQVLGDLENGAPEWHDRVPAPPDALPFPDQATVDELERLVPGYLVAGGPIEYPAASASIFLLTARRDPAASQPDPFTPQPASVVVRVGDSTSVIDLGPVHSRDFAFDVAVVPGWAGSLPAALSAATPLPHLPSPTPRPTEPHVAPPPATTVIPRPYPTPTGASVVPQVSDIPLYPGAIEVDGFTRPASSSTDVHESVQMFATSSTEDAIFDFFEQGLVAAGFEHRGTGRGPNGRTADFVRGKDSVLISTAYIAHPDDPDADGDPPYGYLGGTRRDLELEPGMRYFFVVTLRAP